MGLPRKALLISLVLFCGVYVWIQHNRLATSMDEYGAQKNILYVPSSKWIKPLMLGHEAVFSDFIWIRTLGYFADEIMTKGKLNYLEDLIDLATDLDPRFEKIYIWAGAATIYNSGRISKEKIEASNRILEKGWSYITQDPVGWRHHPEYWQIPQMIGFNYAIELGQKEKGAKFVEAAAKIPGIPEHFKTWGSYLYNRAGQTEKGLRLLEQVYAVEILKSQLKDMESGDAKQKLENKLRYYYGKIYGSKQIQQKIEDFQKKIQGTISIWRSQYYYISFDMFLLLQEEKQDHDSWSAIDYLLRG